MPGRGPPSTTSVGCRRGIDVALRDRAATGDPIPGRVRWIPDAEPQDRRRRESGKGGVVEDRLCWTKQSASMRPRPSDAAQDGSGATRRPATRSTHGVVESRGGDVARHRRRWRGCRAGESVGTHWHGLLRTTRCSAVLLTQVAAVRGKRFEAGRVPLSRCVPSNSGCDGGSHSKRTSGRSALVAIIEGRSDVPPLITHALTGGSVEADSDNPDGSNGRSGYISQIR